MLSQLLEVSESAAAHQASEAVGLFEKIEKSIVVAWTLLLTAQIASTTVIAQGVKPSEGLAARTALELARQMSQTMALQLRAVSCGCY